MDQVDEMDRVEGEESVRVGWQLVWVGYGLPGAVAMELQGTFNHEWHYVVAKCLLRDHLEPPSGFYLVGTAIRGLGLRGCAAEAQPTATHLCPLRGRDELV